VKTVLEFEGEKLVLTHPCQTCGIEIEDGDLCKQCLIDTYMVDDQEEFCGQCDEGYTYHCIDGCCINAEEGCELCQRRCDFCNPFVPTPEQKQSANELKQVLGTALTKEKDL